MSRTTGAGRSHKEGMRSAGHGGVSQQRPQTGNLAVHYSKM